MGEIYSQIFEPENKKKTPLIVFILLFVLTFITCMIAGTQWAYKDFTEINNWHYGIQYAVLILTFLSVHEFGHYFAARLHKVDASLPFYIPFPFTFTLNFGTFGAVIKTRTPIPDKKALFDIGVAGPLGGFIVSIIFLIVGFLTLPSIDYIYSLHPEYVLKFGGKIPDYGLHFGNTIVYWLFTHIFANVNGYIPPMNEIYHYPLLNVGWFGLFVTTLNMLPMGQLDGGHVTYSMFGSRIHEKIAKIMFWFLLIMGLGSLLGAAHDIIKSYSSEYYVYLIGKVVYPPLDWIDTNFPLALRGWSGWFLWALIARFVIKLKHPPLMDDTPLDNKRMVIGWIAIVILLLSFSYTGIYILE
jgi:membrane-associated protease RseP (regulator of RpoE activity)